MLRSDKKGVSTIIAYVLLIGFAVTMSILVYNWLRLYASEDQSQTCPDSVALSIESYSCSFSEKLLNLTIKNRGRFNIHEIVVKVSNDSSLRVGMDRIFPIQDGGYTTELNVNENINISYNISGLNYLSPKYVEIQPVIFNEGKIVYCAETIGQIIDCGEPSGESGSTTNPFN